MTVQQQPVPLTVAVHVPLTFTVRGRAQTIIGEASYPPPPRIRFDDSITRAIGRAHLQRTLIENGVYGSTTDFAKDKGVDQSYAVRLLRLTFLVLDIIEAILDRAARILGWTRSCGR